MFKDFVEERIEGEGATLFVRRAGPQVRRRLSFFMAIRRHPPCGTVWPPFWPARFRSFAPICAATVDLTSQRPMRRTRLMQSVLWRTTLSLSCGAWAINDFLLVPMIAERGSRIGWVWTHPDHVAAMALLDIAPTREMYAGTNAAFAHAYWHWFFLTQPSPLPERMIGADPEGFWKLKCFNQARGDNPFIPEALAEYLNAFADPDAIHASCEDYRAAATIDIAHDDADQGRKLHMPF